MSRHPTKPRRDDPMRSPPPQPPHAPQAMPKKPRLYPSNLRTALHQLLVGQSRLWRLQTSRQHATPQRPLWDCWRKLKRIFPRVHAAFRRLFGRGFDSSVAISTCHAEVAAALKEWEVTIDGAVKFFAGNHNRNILAKRGVSIPGHVSLQEFCISELLRNPGIACVLVGARRVRYVRQLAGLSRIAADEERR
eukprot:GHVT01073142.1.p1 GENE.GHVT01073142.1~~GHVT01073142.1.p1  ORF type:complete len:192 (-),score=27.47 GHVT01073142.1:508-1083(-)